MNKQKLTVSKIESKMPIKHGGQTLSGDFPILPSGMDWIVEGYLCGKFVRQSTYKLSDFDSLFYIGRSNGYHQILADHQMVLICRVDFKQ
jgi:hypothetical protein